MAKKYVRIPDGEPSRPVDFASLTKAFIAGFIGSAVGAILWIPVGYVWHLFAALCAAVVMALCLKIMDMTNFDRPFMALPFAIIQTLVSIVAGSILFTGYNLVKYDHASINFQLPGIIISQTYSDPSFLDLSLRMGVIGIFSVSVIYLGIKLAQRL